MFSDFARFAVPALAAPAALAAGAAQAKGETARMSLCREALMDRLLDRPQESIELLEVLFDRLGKANDRLMLLGKSGNQD